MKRLLTICLIITIALAISLYINGQTIAADPPHSSAQGVYCNSCHSVHNAQSTGLNKYTSNAYLCLYCHTSGGLANNKRFSDSMQATPGVSGSSHSWNATMPATSSPNNPYGLRATADLNSTGLQGMLNTFGNVITCSVCHNQHSQARTTWDPYAPASGDGRHFQRLSFGLNASTSAINDLCEDCHYYRTPLSGQTNVRTYQGGNYTSHPVIKIFTNGGGETPDVNSPNQFNTIPREPASANWSTQTNTTGRYHQNGTSDNNTANNMVVDDTKKVRCLSCHRIHYSESDSRATGTP